MYGSFSTPMQIALRPFVAGKSIVDLGSGDGARAVLLTALGASSVLAIDGNGRMRSSPKIEYVECSFCDAVTLVRKANPDVAHIAWPSNRSDPALIEIISKIPCVVYVGCNTDGTLCGGPDLFKHFVRRPVRERRNTMIVYGSVGSRIRRPADVEEIAGLVNECPDKLYSYDGRLLGPHESNRANTSAGDRIDRMVRADHAAAERNGFVRIGNRWVPKGQNIPIEELFMALVGYNGRPPG